jgi:hypothetical protein
MSTITSGATPRARIHITDPKLWGSNAGSDFWWNCNNADQIAAGSDDLVGHGWISTGGVYLAGSLADFGSSADVGTTGGFHMDTAGDTVASPQIFGDYLHMRMVQEILGYMPTTLNAEFYMRLSANNDEQASGAGFWEAGSTSAFAKADCMAVVASGGTNFELHSGAAEDSGSADSTNATLFKITVTTGSTIEWWINGTSQGTLALQTDLWPAMFGVNTQAAGTNDPILNWAHVWYA